jgi:hypothetical protein
VHAVRSTVNSDGGDWWLSVFALLGLTAAMLVTTMALVHRSVLPTRIGEARARLASHVTPGLRLVVSAAVIAVVVLGVSENKGTASDYISRPKLAAAAAALPANHPPVSTAVLLPAPPPAPDALATVEATKQQMAAQATQTAAAADAAKQQIAKQQAALDALKRSAAKPAITIAQAAPAPVPVAPAPAASPTTTTPPPAVAAQAAPEPQRGLIGGLLHGLLGG